MLSLLVCGVCFVGIFLYSGSWISSETGCSLYAYPLSDLNFVFCLDSISLVCSVMLLICSGFSLLYCSHYFSGNEEGLSLYKLISVFVFVMLSLIWSSSLIVSLIFWEYLGFVSFLLILFYANSSSLRASLITLFSSRFGDVALFVLLAATVSLEGGGVCLYGLVFLFSFLLVLLTKSASFPFIAWLLEAMRAPTPVSSLVHSSTLVAAGVWFCIRYGCYFNETGLLWLFVFSIVSVVISGFCALKFEDLKKIVALSTCNNIAWCMIFYVYGGLDLCMYQLLSHGVSKCFLFMLVGDVMSGSAGSQSAAGVYLVRYYGKLGSFMLSFLIFSLAGLPFIGIFFSKHYLLGSFFGGSLNVVICLLLFLGFILSYAYSCRFLLLLCNGGSGLSLGWYSQFVSVCGVVLLGSVVNVLVVGSLEEGCVLGVVGCWVFLAAQVCGLLWGYWMHVSVGRYWDSLLFGNSVLVDWFYMRFLSVLRWGSLGFYRWELLLAGSFGCGVSAWRGASVSLVVFGFFLVVWCCVC